MEKIADFLATKSKALVAAAVPLVATLALEWQNICKSGDRILAGVGAALVAFGGTYAVKNRNNGVRKGK